MKFLIAPACGLAALLAAGSVAAAEREFRAFAVAYKHEVAAVSSYASYVESVRAQFAAQIAPALRPDVPNLVVYPENQTLMAYLIGARGLAARQLLNEAGAIPALASLALPYAPQIAYYEAKFPGTTAPGQLLQLALTDTLARLVMEIFAPLAAEYGVYLSVTSNLAAFERVSGATAALLADPEAAGDHAYEATAPEVYNRNFIFGPDGELIAIQDKAYLIPIEREQGLGLGLLGIETFDLPVLDLPFARVATVISKDAWMIDVNDRLDQLGAELLLQPEAFSSWGVPGGDLWPPDKFQRGGWWMLQKHASARVNITPMLTGNLGDLSFDGQPLIAVEGPAGVPGLCLMGQSPEPGWAAVGAWSDRLDAAALCDPALRPTLAEQGEAIAPGSGDPRENDYAHDVVFADVRLPARPSPAARLAPASVASRRVRAADTAQLQPVLGAAGQDVYLAWIDSFGEPSQNVALSQLGPDGGWTAPARPAPKPPTNFDHFDNQWAPALLAAGDAPLLAFLDFATENWDLMAQRPGDGEPLRVDDAETSEGTLRERGHSSPRLLDDPHRGRIYALWSDLRWPWVKPQIRLAWSVDGGASWSPSQRADGGPVAGDAEQLDGRDPAETRGQSYPDALILDDGELLIAWQEADADGRPAVWVRRHDPQSGRTVNEFRAPGAGFRPRLLQGAGSQWLFYEARDGRGGRHVRLAERWPEGRWLPPVALDPTAVAGWQQRQIEPLLLAGQPAAVFADDRAGDDDVLLMRLGDSQPLRVDAAAAGIASHSPTALHRSGGELLVVWQQESGQGPRLHFTEIPAKDLPGDPAVTARGGGTPGWLVMLLVALGGLRRPDPGFHPGYP